MTSVPKTLLACIWIYRLSTLRLKSWMVPQICSGSKSMIICNSGQRPIESGPFWSPAVLAIFCTHSMVSCILRKYVVMEERTEVSSPILHMIWLHVTAFHISEVNTSSQRASHPACDSELKESQQQRNSFSIDFYRRHQQNALCTYCRISLQETIWECAWNTSWMRSKQCGCNVISKLPPAALINVYKIQISLDLLWLL